jgi:hypothetical protein
MYDKMPFGIMNTRATFQRAMYIYFIDENDRFIVIYLNGMTIFSKTEGYHLIHLQQVFKKCRKFGLSLNLKKSFFCND